MQKTLGVSLAVVFLAGCVTAPPPAPPKPPVPPPLMIGTPLKTVFTPELQALMDAPTDQQMLVRFSVKADGSVENPAALLTKLSPGDTTTVLQAFRQWRFKPALDGRQPVERDFIYPLFFGPDARQDRTRFFCRNQPEVYAPDSGCEIVIFGQWRIYRMDPVYPPALLSRHLAGSVTLSFNIGARGQALDPKVVAADPPQLFDAAALVAVNQWYFEPLKETKGETPPEHVTVTVKFTPPAADSSVH